MSADNIVAIVTSLGSVIAVIVTVIMSNRLIAYRLEQLEKSVKNLSTLNDRMTKVEVRLDNIERMQERSD